MKTEVIIPAGGSGIRFGGSVPKILVELQGRPLILHSLEVFERAPSISGVIVAGDVRHLDALRNVIVGAGLKKVKAIVPGGETRRASVENGLKRLDPHTDIVMIHDAARPLITVELVEASAADAVQSGANAVGIEVTSTIKIIDPNTGNIAETPDRSLLREIQTPQTFRKDILLDAYDRRGGFEPTDDASLVERAGYPVRVIPGLKRNIKITTMEDVSTAEGWLRM